MTSCGSGGGPDLCPDLDLCHTALLDLLPRGRAWDQARRPQTVSWRFWRAIATVLQIINARICASTWEAFCSTAEETRDQWMIEYGLPDGCDPFPDLCTKVAALGGTRCDYYAEVAARLGWSISCVDLSADCGASTGCAEAGTAQAGGLPGAATLHIKVNLAESPAYTGARVPEPLAGVMQAGGRLTCPPDYSGLVCLMDRMVHAHMRIIYEFSLS